MYSHSRPIDKGAGDIVIFIADANEKDELIGKRRRLLLRSWSTIAEIKGSISNRLHVPSQLQKLFYKGSELKNVYSLQDAGVCRSGETLTWSLSSCGTEYEDYVLRAVGTAKCPRALKHLLLQSKRALIMGLAPSLSLDGSGGCYFFPSPQGNPITVFKPLDEEPFMENNPRLSSYTTSPFQGSPVRMRKGIPPGASCFREVAAYLLDTDHHAGVPQTTLVECAHPKLCYRDRRVIPKLGSLQEFSPNEGTCEDFSYSKFPVDEVHRLAIFDLRILNCDRNSGNILVREQRTQDGEVSHRLIPIDHGFCLPDILEIGWCDLCWLDWPQCKEPFSEPMLHYVLNVVDPVIDADMVFNHLKLSNKCAVLVRLVGLLLQKGAKAGLSLFKIANLVVRQDLDGEELSELELLHKQAVQTSHENSMPVEDTQSDGSLDIDYMKWDSFWNNIDVLLQKLIQKHSEDA